MKIKLIVFLLFIYNTTNAQNAMKDTTFYAQIPEPSNEYTPGAIVSRMVDGLGFRFYWATEGLKEEDLKYKPSDKGRNILQTVDHVLGLSNVILNSAKKEPTVFSEEKKEMSFAEKREAILDNLKIASNLFLKSKDLSKHKIIFVSDKGKKEFPFWNQINGPIEDAVWHAGQIVVLRRSAGNPMNPNANFLTGKLRDK
ncbi:DinB family protein [uncultured Maribacter sp.]|uniref:DinB family protein n=1 Tax=uncultured Maribacter sp. TaxID=431308 RepID=UPI0026129ECA|nr:DinB family protein [uncultured Maribacter sp.]